ncbi:DUF533 domain-containing protein [Yoonia litorea]|uniref:Uncharacterized membrane protein YebE, DUF533 family n=1 Tax=Yoonia litorea TaxID=1123755 RepID=A0A1I6MZY4_9RHOB|nr:DUF533 domain-containing protein [Yoonia litorea]SFS21275.1 Uncharacterized membrane protein YebE, DUF533 family [Yoonia litorea]
MSIKRMVTKLALAFAAKKGVEIFNNAGGVDGVRDMLAGRKAPPQPDTQTAGMHGRIGGTRAAGTGGLGNILDSLGHAGATNGRESGVTGQVSPLNQSLGGLFGTLAAALGHQSQPEQAASKLEEEFETSDITRDEEAKPLVRAMVQMARADGNIDDQEKSALFDILQDATTQEQATLQDALHEPINPKAIADDTPPHARKQVYTAALLVGDPEHPNEKQFLASLGSNLGLNDREVAALHDAVGKPQLAA